MIHFRTADGVFNYRVAGLCIQDGWVLLHRMNEDPFWTVPGGRCEMLEPSAEALKREMREEL
ncbi:MAG TPA: NUDIX domain-containing protein, partial [Chloroflexota bacterium]